MALCFALTSATVEDITDTHGSVVAESVSLDSVGGGEALQRGLGPSPKLGRSRRGGRPAGRGMRARDMRDAGKEVNSKSAALLRRAMAQEQGNRPY